MPDKYGVDLSRYQTVTWEQRDPAFMEFAIVQCWQGYSKDPLYDSHIQGLQSHHVPFGSYLLPRGERALRAELDDFLAARLPGQVRDALDLEWALPLNQVSDALKEGARILGRKWLFYSNYNLLLNHYHQIRSGILDNADIWLAWPKYQGTIREIPGWPSIQGYPSPQPLIWQFDWHSRPGWIQKAVDRNKILESTWSQVVSEDEEPPLTLEQKVAELWALKHSY